MKTFVLGDPHGNCKGMKQCFEKSGINKDEDTLIVLGDIVDGYPEVKECFNELLKFKNLIYIKGNHDCLDEETELLTKRGWIKYNEIRENDNILSLNENNYYEWTNININGIIIKKHKGKMVDIENKHCDMKMTLKHRVIHKKPTSEKYIYNTAEKIKGRLKIPVSAKNSNIKGLDITDDQLRFIAWILTDGMLCKAKTLKQTNLYCIYQSKPDMCDYIRNLLNKMNYKFTEVIKKYNGDLFINGIKLKSYLPAHEFRLLNESNKEIQKYFPDKYPFPEYLFNMNTRQFDIFIDVIIKGDGIYSDKQDKTKCRSLYGKYDFLSNIQILCIMNGYRAVLNRNDKTGHVLYITNSNDTSFDTCYKKKIYNYDGIIWCLNVPYTNFMVRRNGKPFFTGNCWFEKWVITHGEFKEPVWTYQGGQSTILSYGWWDNVPKEHIMLIANAPYYYVDDKNRVFVHGGLKIGEKIEKTDHAFLMWDRDLYDFMKRQHSSKSYKSYSFYDEIYIGHTDTRTNQPALYCNLINMDSGAGWAGCAAIMDIDTKEYWCSDLAPYLYPDENQRYP